MSFSYFVFWSERVMIEMTGNAMSIDIWGI